MFPIQAMKTSKDSKQVKAEVVTADWGRQGFLPQKGKWLDDFLSEMSVFPSASYSKQVEALSQALLHLKSRPERERTRRHHVVKVSTRRRRIYDPEETDGWELISLPKTSKKVYDFLSVRKKWFAGITERVCSHYLIGLSCPGGKKMRWIKKWSLVLLSSTLIATWSSVCAQVQQKYNPLTNEWETVNPNSMLKYNPFSGRWVYAAPNAVLKHNPMENRWEMVSPDSELRYNLYDGTWSFAPPGAKLQLSPFSGQLVYPHWCRRTNDEVPKWIRRRQDL
jgi:hypothetical protein